MLIEDTISFGEPGKRVHGHSIIFVPSCDLKLFLKLMGLIFFLRKSVNFFLLDIQMVPYIHWSKFVDSNIQVPKTFIKNSSKFQKAKLEFALRLFT